MEIKNNKILFAFILCVQFGVSHKNEDAILVKISTGNSVGKTSESFLSIALGSTKRVLGWRSLKVRPKILSLTKELSPAYFRIGGFWEDFLYWQKQGEEKRCFNETEAEHLWDFAEATGIVIAFGLPGLRRNPDGSWNPKNILEFVKFIDEKGYKAVWELGNEPDRWREPYLNMTPVPPEQLAKEFTTLKTLLKDNGIQNTMLSGPDVSSIHGDNEYFTRFLNAVSHDVLHWVTYHQYYRAGKGAKLQDFINVTLLDEFIDESNGVINIVRQNLGDQTPVCLDETSSMYNRGARGLSDVYVAGFMWLDKLGIAALAHHYAVFRQTLYGGKYGLLNGTTFDPTPDYWSSVLYKRLVGQKVLMVEGSLNKGRKTRIYAHCTKISNKSRYRPGAVTLIALNLKKEDDMLIVHGDIKSLSVDQYLLQPGEKNKLTSRDIRLNGNLLKLLPNYKLPELNPAPVLQPLILPALTYAFYVIPEANAAACMTNDISQRSIKV